MANKKPKKKEAKMIERYLLLKNGVEKKIIAETGKYWICEDAQYRKLSDMIWEVGLREALNEEAVEETEEIASEEAVQEIVQEVVEENTEPIPVFEEGFDNIPTMDDII